MSFFKKEFKSKFKIYFSIVTLWVICNIFSIFGFYWEYNKIPEVVEALVINHITLLFSIPKSFADALFLTNKYDVSGTIPAMGVFWTLVIYLGKKLFFTKSIFLFCVLGLMFLIASWRWLVLATGMMGI
jgi:hypothetical protein